MQFVSRLSTQTTVSDAYLRLTEGIGQDGPWDFVSLFCTGHWRRFAPALAQAVRDAMKPRVLVGVTCESVIGAEREVERMPAVAMLAGRMPGVDLQPFHIEPDEWRTILADDERFQQRIGTGADHRGQLVLADPFSTPVDPFLERLDGLLKAPTFGGMASGGSGPGQNVLLLNDQVHRGGAIGVGFGGPIRLETVVSQGCRPIAEPMIVTKAADGVILELGRRPALEVAEAMLAALSDAERLLVRNGLFVGVVINEYQESFRRGDFLVRGLLGADRATGGIAIGDVVRAGQTIQFHVRDAATAAEDMEALLAARTAGQSPTGGLLFTCNGRGTRMFDGPNHDVNAVHASLPGLPVAGFFAMGELGPIGGRTFIHGHTASMVFFNEGESAPEG